MKFTQLLEEVKQGQVKLFKETARKRYYVTTYNKLYSVNSKNEVREIKLNAGKNGYVIVRFSDGAKSMQRIVAETFLDNPDNLPDVDHIDFDRSNNRLDNLRWSSRKDNVRHSYDNGRYNKAHKTINLAKRKFTDGQVEEIRAKYNAGAKKSHLAREYQVDNRTIYNIVNFITYIEKIA